MSQAVQWPLASASSLTWVGADVVQNLRHGNLQEAHSSLQCFDRLGRGVAGHLDPFGLAAEQAGPLVSA